MTDQSGSFDMKRTRTLVDKLSPDQLAQADAVVLQLEEQFVEQLRGKDREAVTRLFGTAAEQADFVQRAQGQIGGAGEPLGWVSGVILTIRIRC